MNLKSNLNTYLNSQFDNFHGIGLALFLTFFICEGIEVYHVRAENDRLTNAIAGHTETLNDDYDRLITSLVEVSRYKRSLKTMVDMAHPYICLIESYRHENGDIIEFLSQLKEERNERVEVFDNLNFDEIILKAKMTEKYTGIKRYLLARAKIKLASTLVSYVGSGGCYLISRKPFIIYEKIGSKHHFYPNNFAVVEGQSYYRVKGKICRGEYHWKPKRKGIHYFDLEYINVEGFKVYKKKFKIELKVV